MHPSIPDASVLDGAVMWRKPRKSGGNNNCVECGDLSQATWQKAIRSGGNNNCVETTSRPCDGMAVRDSKNPTGPALLFDHATWTAFTEAIKAGEFATV